MTRSILNAVLVLGALHAPAARAQVAPGTVVDEIVAVVDDGAILRSEVDAVASQLAGNNPVTAESWSRALDEIVDERVLAAHAARDTTLTVTPDQVTQQVNERISALASQMGGEERVAGGAADDADAGAARVVERRASVSAGAAGRGGA